MKELRNLFKALGIFGVLILILLHFRLLPPNFPDGFYGFALICIPIGVIGEIWDFFE